MAFPPAFDGLAPGGVAGALAALWALDVGGVAGALAAVGVAGALAALLGRRLEAVKRCWRRS